MNLSECYYSNPILSDKGTIHSYIKNYYCEKFTPMKELPVVILEIGIFQGGSTKLWKKWFKNSTVYGIDNNEKYMKFYKEMNDGIGILGNAYSERMLNKFSNQFFDIIIEDGAHTLETQMYTAKRWTTKLKNNGILIIEDIQDINHIDNIIQAVPKNENFSTKVFDLRSKINRYDDIIIEITKN